MTDVFHTGAVAIGRNEGARLERCLDALQQAGGIEHIVYVDSGSTDGSMQMARAKGVHVVDLDMTIPFTAARARNAGLEALCRISAPDYVQFIDGDCVLDANWLSTARAVLPTHPKVAVVCGRRREIYPGASVYNRLIDDEWNTPIGTARACGGDALMRVSALSEVGGFNADMIAGEEPELCVRLRQAGWSIERLDAEMTLHDAAIMGFGQWWKRAWRAGHAYGEGAALHGAAPEFHNVAQRRRALIWGLGIPLVVLLGTIATPWSLLLLALWPAQVLRLMLRKDSLAKAFFLTLSKLPEACGTLEYMARARLGRRAKIIEYKSGSSI